MRTGFVLLLIFISFSSFSKCTKNSNFLDKYGHFLNEMKSISSFNTSNNDKGTIKFESIAPKSFILKYRYEFGVQGFFLFILDLEDDKIYLSQYSDGAKIQKTMISGEFREKGCALDFIVSEKEKATINFGDDLNITFYYRSGEQKELKVVSKFYFK